MIRLLTAAALISGLLLASACGGRTPPGDAARIDADLVDELTPADAGEVGRAVDKFAFDLLDAVAVDGSNTVTSPLSAALLLAMISAGADGDTATEMAHVLGLRPGRDPRVGALLRELADTEEVTLSVANALYSDGPLEDDYVKFVRRTFGATLEQADLASPQTAEAMDEWVRENTNGRIEGIARDLGLPDPQAVLVLLNTVYFLGRWTTSFDEADTRPVSFATPGGPVDVPTMHLRDRTFPYTQRAGYRMIRLPYGEDERFGMEIVLPDKGEPELDAAEWRAAVDSLAPVTIDELALPRFELRWSAGLRKPLEQLGMRTAFMPGRADFRPMSPAAPAVGSVVQKTYIRVDEAGTEAAAVTGGVMVTSARMDTIEFRVDRPFLFTISDRETGTILFLGRVTDPR
ncbi:serpin family protein [Actinoplanes sp. TRM 88003]|uniref:Serpin family protein n=1 Tax=Paractinoplanes aksuensis TaxID=2939490 RepID=A0ABT1DLN9_9ACTN|nr:serpin family protein [Actinoplanes aksuensis]MCO8271724.1 serpin family protein [Actinoplanes aksuensis]